MEFIIVGALIIVLMLCLGFGWGDIAVLVLGIAAVIIVGIGCFFVVCLVMLTMSKRRTAVFTEFNEEGKFPRAVYRIDGKDVTNMFPCEMIMRGRLYVPKKETMVLYCLPLRSAIDKNALITMILGSVIFIPFAVFAAASAVVIFGGMFG